MGGRYLGVHPSWVYCASIKYCDFVLFSKVDRTLFSCASRCCRSFFKIVQLSSTPHSNTTTGPDPLHAISFSFQSRISDGSAPSPVVCSDIGYRISDIRSAPSHISPTTPPRDARNSERVRNSDRRTTIDLQIFNEKPSPAIYYPLP